MKYFPTEYFPVEWLHNHPMNFLSMATNSSLDLYLYIFIIVIHISITKYNPQNSNFLCFRDFLPFLSKNSLGTHCQNTSKNNQNYNNLKSNITKINKWKNKKKKKIGVKVTKVNFGACYFVNNDFYFRKVILFPK